MGCKIESRLTISDLRETPLISLSVRFIPFLHKYATSLAPPLLTLPAFAFAALEPLLGSESNGEKKGEGRGREREREREGEGEREEGRGTAQWKRRRVGRQARERTSEERDGIF